MQYLRPIPLTLLPHKIILKKPLGEDKFGKTEYKTIEISNVRVELSLNGKSDVKTKDIIVKAHLYYDFENSVPQTEFSPFDRVVFMEKEYEVSGIKTCMGADKPHHLKITLC